MYRTQSDYRSWLWELGHGAYIPAKAWLAQEGTRREQSDAVAVGRYMAGCTAYSQIRRGGLDCTCRKFGEDTGVCAG